MTKEMAIQRIEKAEETINKKRNTIEKKTAQALKKIEKLRKLGVEYSVGKTYYSSDLMERGMDKEAANEAYWLQCDISSLHDDIDRAEKEIKEREEKLPEYRKALEEAEQIERIIENDIPDSMKKAKADLVQAWTEYDMALKAKMWEDNRRMNYEEFTKKYAYTTREAYMYTDEETFRKRNEREAQIWLIDLYNRVKEITGNITDTGRLTWGGKCLDGKIIGEKGTAIVNTIEAGGYNIQKWHLRVLVKKAK